MKKRIIVFIVLPVLCFFTMTINAQEKWSLKLSYGQVNAGAEEYKMWFRDYKRPHFRIDASREIIGHLHAGVYVGYSRLQSPIFEIGNGFSYVDGEEIEQPVLTSIKTNAVFYGLNVNYQLLPLLTGRENLRFELYPVVKLGVVSEFWETFIQDDDSWYPAKEHHDRTNFEFGAGIGAAYRFTKKFAVFGEGTFGMFDNGQNFRFHAGVRFNF